jgi:hypothetical protein
LELIGDDERCVALAGLLPVRLLAERGGLRAGISAAMRRPGYDPDYDRGQVLIDLGLVLLAGGQAIGDFQGLAHLEKLIGPVPSTPTVWRSLDEADGLQVARVHQAVCRFRRLWWGMLADRPEGFPWLKVAGRELTSDHGDRPGRLRREGGQRPRRRTRNRRTRAALGSSRTWRPATTLMTFW